MELLHIGALVHVIMPDEGTSPLGVISGYGTLQGEPGQPLRVVYLVRLDAPEYLASGSGYISHVVADPGNVEHIT